MWLSLTDDVEQLVFVVVFAAEDGGVDEEQLGQVGVVEVPAVQFQDAELGVDDAFDVRPAEADLVLGPQDS